MTKQIHKKFTNEQVKELLEKYINKELERKYIEQILGLKKARFFRILAAYRKNPRKFSVEYKRFGQTRSIDPKIKKNIIKELAIDKNAIKNDDIPLYKYNYSYIKKRLKDTYNQSAALSTVIKYAKTNDFYLPKQKVKLKDHTAGSKITLFVPAFVKMSKISTMLNAFLTTNANAIITNNSTLQLKKSLPRDLIPL